MNVPPPKYFTANTFFDRIKVTFSLCLGALLFINCNRGFELNHGIMKSRLKIKLHKEFSGLKRRRGYNKFP